MSFMDIRLPVKISLGSTSGVMFKTDVVVYGNGQEYRNSRWDTQKSSYDISYAVKNRQDAIEIYKIFLAAEGKFRSFRVKDYLDYTSAENGSDTPTAADQEIGIGDGSTTQFQLKKLYNSGAGNYYRNITKPVDGTVVVQIQGVTTTNFTVDYSTGIISLNDIPGVGDVVRAGFEFDVEARFDQDEIEGIAYVLTRPDSSRDVFSFPTLRVVEVL